MEIKLNSKESEEYFFSALCNGLGYVRGYGLELTCTDKDYNAAKSRLFKKNPKETICFEDVYMEILRGGKSIKMVDHESGEYTKTINLQDIHERVQKTPIRHLTDMIEENDDATTADVILQTVFFEDVIFG
jgi:hypothetical protein